MKPTNKIILPLCGALSLGLFLSSCQDGWFDMGSNSNSDLRISLSATIDQLNLTRANDHGFADGDKIGVYAVIRNADGTPGLMTPDDNLASNVRFTFDEANIRWNGDRDLYFEDNKSAADFYGYYPYDSSISNVMDYPFTVERDQSKDIGENGLSSYEASDFLWAKDSNISPENPNVNLTFHHMLACVRVTLIEGDGFDQGEWNELDKKVLVGNTCRTGTINLASGAVTTVGEADNMMIVTKPSGDEYRGIVLPQSVAASRTVIAVNVGTKSYKLIKETAMTYAPSKMHNFTIEIKKSANTGDYQFTLMDESITPWESDPDSHNGLAKEYVIVEVPVAGGLEQAINKAGLNPTELKNLKVKGEMTGSDFSYLKENCKYLEALNLKEVLIRNCSTAYYGDKPEDYVIPYQACHEMLYLKTIVFPDKLKKIGEEAFRNTNLCCVLDFPEGLEYIGVSAFSNWQNYTQSNLNLTGELRLPTTLKYIGNSAFENNAFTGELVLPESLEYLGSTAFRDCKNLKGEIHLPTNLKELGEDAFAKCVGLTGKFIYPQGLSIVKSVGGAFSSYILPEHPTKIEDRAFENTLINGDLVLPESVTQIGESAFYGSKLSHIVLPSKLVSIGATAFFYNENLIDTVVIPPLIEIIEEATFEGCAKLDAVVLPKNLLKIKGSAFRDCFSLTYIRCDAPEPPELDESAFYGVNKDNFTIEVPEASVDAYRKAPGWREFKRIAAYRNFVARPSKYNVINNGDTKKIVLNADGAWEMTSCPSWCHIDKTSGFKKTEITLTVDAMAHGTPNREGTITFKLKDSAEHQTHISVNQLDYEHDEDACITLQKASVGNGVDLFFVGDGYDAYDIANGIYLEDMKQEMEYLFAVEPYLSYREYFNVYTSIALSEDSGTEDINHWRNTKFHFCTGDGGCTRLSADWQKAFEYCATTVPQIANKPNASVGVVLIGNTTVYEGVTYIVGDSFCAVVTKSDSAYPNDARGLIQHEAGGHGIGWLADEYMYHRAFIQKCGCSCCKHERDLRQDHANGYGLNLSLTGKYTEVPWRHLIHNREYGDIVDIYEGGYFHSRGVYRSEYNSCMNNNVPYFSTWSRQLIVQRIMKLAGEPFSLESFYAKDSRQMGKDFTGTRAAGKNMDDVSAHHGNAPIFIKNYKFGKKGGRK